MTRARDIANLVDANGDVKTGNLDNVQADVVDDTTPQLGGTLDTNGNSINDASGVTLQHNGTNKFATTANGIETLNGTDISMSQACDGQIRIDGLGYTGAIALDASAMNIYNNSGSRGIVFGTNETERMKIHAGGAITARSEGGTAGVIDLRQGAAKGWRDVDNTGTQNLRESYNVSSVSDHATGQINTNWNNDFNNQDYAYAGSQWSTTSNGGAVHGYDQLSAAAVRVATEDVDSGFRDYDHNYLIAHGDLA